MNSARLSLYLLIWLGVATSPLAGQLPKLPEITAFGIDGFRLMLQHRGLRTARMDIGRALEESPQDTVLVIFGDLSLVPRFSRQIERFVSNGGCLLMASDLRGLAVPPTNILGVWVKPAGNVRSSQAYRGFRDCPVVRDFDRDLAPSLFEGVETIVANRPGQLTFARSAAQSIAWLPSRRSRTRPALMAAHQSDGRMLFVADHSIFTNQMLVHGDNARFVKNVTDWLCADGKRKQLAIIHNNRVLPAWGLGDTPPAIPLSNLLRAVQRGGLENLPIGDSVFPMLNASLADFQRKNEFNNYLRKVSTQLFGRRPIRIVLLLLSAFAIVSLISRLGVIRSRPRRWMSFQDWRRPVEPKLDGAYQEKNYQPCIRSLAREFFVASGLPDWNLPRGPIVHLDSSTVRSKAKRQVHMTWKVATTPSRRRMSKRQFEKALNVIKNLCELQRSGDLSLEWP